MTFQKLTEQQMKLWSQEMEKELLTMTWWTRVQTFLHPKK